MTYALGSRFNCLLGLSFAASCASQFEPPISGGECSESVPCETGTCDIQRGACIADDQTIYVAAVGAAEPGCGDSAAGQPPCNTISAGIRRAVSLGRGTVSIASGDQFLESLAIESTAPLHLIGFGASVQSDGSTQEHLYIAPGSDVEISGLSFDGLGEDSRGIVAYEGARLALYEVSVTNYGRDGVNVGGVTELADQTSLTIESSTIANNGSLSLDASAVSVHLATFSIRNTAIVDNHVGGMTFGLASVTVPVSFEFNTLANNGEPFYCGSAEPSLEFSFVGNIVDDGAECPEGAFEHSWVPTDTLGSNLATRPSFVDAPAGDYRLASASSGIDVAELDGIAREGDVGADGVARPRGAAPDIGAFEF